MTSAAAQRASHAAQAMTSAVSRIRATAAAAADLECCVELEAAHLWVRLFVRGVCRGADGTVEAIDQVEPGDDVLATDPETGEKEAKRVEATHGHDGVVLTLLLTTSTGERREIRTTEDHPFWLQTEQEFQRADELDPGELVLTADGGTMEVDAVLTE